jgi:protein required for attachment to host cells
MILPTGATVAVADGETVRLFHNIGVKPGVHLVEITAAPPAPARAGSGARHHIGEMRKHFHRDLRDKIMGELAKDFSRRPLEDIASLIAGA